MEAGDDRPTGKEKVWAVVRMFLGLGQMMAAVVTFYVLIQTGMNALSLGAVAVTCLLTSLSVLLFGSRK